MQKFVLLLLVTLSYLVSPAQCTIIPTPVVYKMEHGEFHFSKKLSVKEREIPTALRTVFRDKFRQLYTIKLINDTSNFQLRFKRINNTPKDYYTITVDDGIVIQYSSEASCFYAFNSLLQLIQNADDTYFIQRCFVQDYPNFEWRGLHLDVSRHFFTVQEVMRYIDLMSLYKFNTFHWHLTDDQGWRIEIKKYPKLTSVGAWRDSTVNNHYATQPRTYTKEHYGGFYTQAEIKEVVQYAQERFITIVPEIEMPGHSRAALAAYPNLSCTGKSMNVPGLWGVFDDIFCTKDTTFEFIYNVLDEVIALFPSTYIHIGGDEAPKMRWKQCAECQHNIQVNGLKDEHELQSWFIRKIDAYLTLKGKKLIGWDEILEGGISPNATIMSWRGFEGGETAAKQQHYAVMSPGSHCYFDHYQSTNSNEPLAIGGYTPLQKVYEFNPIPAGLNSRQAAYILGGQANLWTEYIPTMKQLEYMVYPRALALSQVLWCKNKPSFEDFTKTFKNYQLTYLNRHHVNYSRAFFYPEMKLKRSKEGLSIQFVGNEPTDQFQLLSESDSGRLDTLLVDEHTTLTLKRTSGKVQSEHYKLYSPYTEKPQSFHLVAHPALGFPVEYITKPSERYNNGGDLTLVDGVIGVKPWKGNEWVGFDTGVVEFSVDLEKVLPISSFQLNFLEDKGSWIHLPNTIQLSYSKDKTHWESLEEKQVVTNLSKTNEMPSVFVQSVSKSARYIKVLVKRTQKIPEGESGEGNQPWIFMDELMLFFDK